MRARISRRKNALLMALAVAIILVFFLLFRASPLEPQDAVAISSAGFTNAPGDQSKFALFMVTNKARFDVRWRGDWVEIEGKPERKARIANPSLPGARYAPILKAGESLTLAVGEPNEAAEGSAWRLNMSYSKYGLEEHYFDFSSKHKLPLKIGRLALVDAQKILNPTNRLTAVSAWLPTR